MSAAQPATGPSGEARPAVPAAPPEPPTVPAAANLAPPAPPRAGPPGRQPGRQPARRPAPRDRRWLRWLRVIALVIAFPVVALGIGLLVAWIVHTARGNPSPAPTRLAPPPSASAVPSAPASSAPPRVVVPADWVVETNPPAGLTFRHPPGWIRRTELPVILRFAPASAGSTIPGVEGIGAGIEPNAAPSQALAQFVTRAYGTQPQLQQGPVTSVAAAHAGELQEVVTYSRGGVPVRVVVRAFSNGGGNPGSVVVLGRAASANPTRAAELEAAVEASLQLSG